MSESRTVSPTAIVRLPCAASTPGHMASRTHSLHGSISPRNLPGLSAAHNLGGGGGEVRHNGDAEGARLRRVRRAATRRR